ncbi:uncharacterized protein [Clinocottus analis]|uniref:uncharacterized protein n=1 Tax=Clinocottus analis TaxID=304258 RepID=UPI0035C0B574
MSTSRGIYGPGAAAPCHSSSSSSSSSSSVNSSGNSEPDPDLGLLFPVSRSSLLTRRLLSLRARASSHVVRRRREMTPTDQKDLAYWDKRLKNNEAAKRSRDKRRLSDLMLEGQLLALSEENAQLRAQLRAQRSDACATSTSPGSTFPRIARPVHCPDLFQPRLWGNGSAASVPGARPQETAPHPFEAKISCSSATRGVGGFTPHGSYHNCGVSPRSLSPRAAVEGGRSTETDAQRQVSSSDDIHDYAEAFSPTPPDALRHASLLSPRNWLLPPLNHSALMCSNLLLPWRSSHLASAAAVYPDLPLYMRERHGLGLGVGADTQWGFRSPAASPLRMHLSPDGR